MDSKTLSLFLPCAVECFSFSDTQFMSNSHKYNPLCCIMFLFTFQECDVVRGVLSLSFCPLLLFLQPLLLCLQSKPLLPTLPVHSNPFLLSKEEELDYLTPPVWASHLPVFLPVDHQPARVVMEGEILRSSISSSPASEQHAWCCTVQTAEE